MDLDTKATTKKPGSTRKLLEIILLICLANLVTFAIILAGWWFIQRIKQPDWVIPTEVVNPLAVVETIQPTKFPALLSISSFTPKPSSTSKKTSTPKPTKKPSVTSTLIIVVKTIKNAFVRSGPGTVYTKVNSYTIGTNLEVLGCNAEGTWLLIKTPDGSSSWIAITLVDFPYSVSSLTVYPDPPTPTATRYKPPTPNRSQQNESTPTPIKYP